MQNRVSNIVHNLLEKVFQNDFKGYDPYDIKAHPFILSLIKWGNKFYLFEVIREVFLELIYHFPYKARALFSIKPSHNSKALGLIGTSCVELSQFEKEPMLKESLKRVDELLDQYKTTYEDGGIGWGYPFDWQSKKLIPSQTPNGIVTTAVGEYYWTLFKTEDDDKYLNQCIDIARFLNQLPVDETSEDRICFSYVPHYQNHVHNLNLFVADYLIKVGLEIDEQEWVDKGHKALNYTLAEQRNDGSFDYNGPPEKPKNFIDNYHTGFVLRMLASTYHYTQREDIKLALNKGLNYYLTHLFDEEGTPKLKPDQKYRIDIHSAAEAINCLVVLAPYDDRAFPMAEKVLKWTLDNLFDESEGDFFYAILKSRFTGRTFRSEIKYIRWAQAWMLRALCRYLLYSEQHKSII